MGDLSAGGAIAVGNATMDPRIKTMSLLLALLGLVGEPVLREAVDALRAPQA